MTHVLVARQDNAGDVLLAGPAIRALAAGADRVLAYRKLFEDGPATISAWLERVAGSPA